MSRSDARSSSLRRRPSRTVPAAVTSTLVAALGLGLVWASVLRLLDGSWPTWVGSTHKWAAGHTWGSPIVLLIAVFASALGLALVVAALAPGRPNAYEIEVGDLAGGPGADSTQFVMTRRSVAKLATAHGHAVDGVDAVSAVVTGRAVRLTVTTASAESEQIERTVTDVVGDALRNAGLTPMPAVSTTARTRTP